MKSINAIASKLMRRFHPVEPRPESAETVPMTDETVRWLLYFDRLLKMVADVDGTIVECGVARGETLLMLTLLAHAEGRGREVWAFDSFEGLPEPGVNDISARDAKKGDLAFSLESVRALLLDCGLPVSFLTANVRFVKGYFADSLREYRGGPIALLHLDVDLYDSYRCALRELQPQVASGGVTAFDEYLNAIDHWPGARKAIDEYFGLSAAQIKRDALSGKYYRVNVPT